MAVVRITGRQLFELVEDISSFRETVLKRLPRNNTIAFSPTIPSQSSLDPHYAYNVKENRSNLLDYAWSEIEYWAKLNYTWTQRYLRVKSILEACYDEKVDYSTCKIIYDYWFMINTQIAVEYDIFSPREIVHLADKVGEYEYN
jgi:hypothetical protein